MLSSSSRGAPAASASSISAGRAPRPPAAGRAAPPARAATASPTPPASAAWFSLIRMKSYRPARWLTPPPSATARFSSARRPGRRLARVEQLRGAARRRDRPHDRRRQRGDARQPPEEVQRGPLGRQQRARRALDAQHRGGRLAPLPLRPEPLDGRVRVEPQEHRLGDAEPGDHAGRLLRDRGDGRGRPRAPSPRRSRRRRRRPRRARGRSARDRRRIAFMVIATTC